MLFEIFFTVVNINYIYIYVCIILPFSFIIYLHQFVRYRLSYPYFKCKS